MSIVCVCTAALPSTGSALACQQGQKDRETDRETPAPDDDDTPVGRNIMPADSPHLQVPCRLSVSFCALCLTLCTTSGAAEVQQARASR